ncbi:MAG: hypothetical protein EOP42_13880 [Sphingobacteriaceae bacterium]|nr:MAG: hypothetical protein EOP42_13880 [Sphingobacteriaceae bacterium]
MIKTASILTILLLVNTISYSQSTQQKAQLLVKNYLTNHAANGLNTNFKLSNIRVLTSSYTDTKQYKNYQHKIDSLKLEGRKIDAKIPKLKTEMELDQAKRDSKNLSNQLVTVSDQMIDFMTAYKSKPIGWTVKSISKNKTKTFYLDEALTKITSVK